MSGIKACCGEPELGYHGPLCTVEKREVVLRDALSQTAGRSAGTEQGQGRECTGMMASWCDVHGACICPRDDEGGWLASGPTDGHGCPLHDFDSDHPSPSVPPARDSGRDEAREAVARDDRCALCRGDMAADCGHHSWAGLMALLDEHWPADIFPTVRGDNPSRDAGARIVSLMRWVDELLPTRVMCDGDDGRPATVAGLLFDGEQDVAANYCAECADLCERHTGFRPIGTIA